MLEPTAAFELSTTSKSGAAGPVTVFGSRSVAELIEAKALSEGAVSTAVFTSTAAIGSEVTVEQIGVMELTMFESTAIP